MHVDGSGALTVRETQDFDIILRRHAQLMANHLFKHRSSTSLGGAITVCQCDVVAFTQQGNQAKDGCRFT